MHGEEKVALLWPHEKKMTMGKRRLHRLVIDVVGLALVCRDVACMAWCLHAIEDDCR